MNTERADVLVIGAGPAGAAAAWSAARLGAGRVLLVERCAWPRTKVCGSCVNPAALRILARTGILAPGTLAAERLTRLRLRAGGRSSTIKMDAGAAIERRDLDAALVAGAQRVGAEFRSGCSAKVVGRDDTGWRVRLGEEDFSARVVVACDGLAGGSLGSIAAPERLGVRVDPASWMGAGAVIPVERSTPWLDAVGPGEVAMHVADMGYVGLVRLPGGRIDVAAALDSSRVKDCGGPAAAMAAVLRFCGVENALDLLAHEPMAGVGLLTRQRERSAVPGLIIAGDAAGYVEPFTGEGIAWALVQGEHAGVLAARAAVDRSAWSELAVEWPAWLAAKVEPRRVSCRALRWTIRHRRVRRVAAAALSRSAIARAGAKAIVRRTWRGYPAPVTGRPESAP